MQEQHYNHFDNERIELINPKNNEEKESKEFLLDVLQNLEKDLIINNNCQKEFDLENENNANNFEKERKARESEAVEKYKEGTDLYINGVKKDNIDLNGVNLDNYDITVEKDKIYLKEK